MSVAELIEELKKMPQDATVFSEGCDCTGNVDGVWLDGSDVMISRSN